MSDIQGLGYTVILSTDKVELYIFSWTKLNNDNITDGQAKDIQGFN